MKVVFESKSVKNYIDEQLHLFYSSHPECGTYILQLSMWAPMYDAMMPYLIHNKDGSTTYCDMVVVPLMNISNYAMTIHYMEYCTEDYGKLIDL